MSCTDELHELTSWEQSSVPVQVEGTKLVLVGAHVAKITLKKDTGNL